MVVIGVGAFSYERGIPVRFAVPDGCRVPHLSESLLDASARGPALQERCLLRQKPRVERLKAKVEPLLT